MAQRKRPPSAVQRLLDPQQQPSQSVVPLPASENLQAQAPEIEEARRGADAAIDDALVDQEADADRCQEEVSVGDISTIKSLIEEMDRLIDVGQSPISPVLAMEITEDVFRVPSFWKMLAHYSLKVPKNLAELLQIMLTMKKDVVEQQDLDFWDRRCAGIIGVQFENLINDTKIKRFGEDNMGMRAAAFGDHQELKHGIALEVERSLDPDSEKLAVERCVGQHIDLIFQTVFGEDLESLLQGGIAKITAGKGILARLKSILSQDEDNSASSKEELAEKKLKITEILTEALQAYIDNEDASLKEAIMGASGHCPALRAKLQGNNMQWVELGIVLREAVFESTQYANILVAAKAELRKERSLNAEISRHCISMFGGRLLIELKEPDVTKAALTSLRHELEADGFMQLYPELPSTADAVDTSKQ